jgi:hypothetical protein
MSANIFRQMRNEVTSDRVYIDMRAAWRAKETQRGGQKLSESP